MSWDGGSLQYIVDMIADINMCCMRNMKTIKLFLLNITIVLFLD